MRLEFPKSIIKDTLFLEGKPAYLRISFDMDGFYIIRVQTLKLLNM